MRSDWFMRIFNEAISGVTSMSNNKKSSAVKGIIMIAATLLMVIGAICLYEGMCAIIFSDITSAMLTLLGVIFCIIGLSMFISAFAVQIMDEDDK